MSDTFSHRHFAYEDLNRAYLDGDGFDNGPGYDPNHYHKWEEIGGIVRETEKAYLVHALPAIQDFNVWVAKSLIRGMAPDKKRIFVHHGTYLSIIKNRIREMQDAVNSFDVLD